MPFSVVIPKVPERFNCAISVSPNAPLSSLITNNSKRFSLTSLKVLYCTSVIIKTNKTGIRYISRSPTLSLINSRNSFTMLAPNFFINRGRLFLLILKRVLPGLFPHVRAAVLPGSFRPPFFRDPAGGCAHKIPALHSCGARCNNCCAFCMECFEIGHDRIFTLHIHSNGWFIQQKDLWIVDNPNCEIDPPFHSSGEGTDFSFR